MRQAGFTLIELLVAVSIGVMLIVGGAVVANSFNARQKVDAVSSQIAEVVNLARNYAMTREKPAGYTDPVEYVVVTLSVGGTAKVMAGSNIGGTDAAHAYTTRKIDIQGILLTPINDGDLIFSVPEGKLLKYSDANHKLAEAKIGATNVVITVNSDLDYSNWKNVDVSTSGVIRDNIQLACPDLCAGTFTTETEACYGEGGGCTAVPATCKLHITCYTPN